MRTRIVPYKIGSESAKLLARELGLLRCNPRSTRFVPRSNDLVINYGCSSNPFREYPTHILNDYYSVLLAANKESALMFMSGAAYPVNTVPFTNDVSEALQWQQDGNVVYCRHLLNSHGGNGITVIQQGETIPSAPLYTKGIKVRQEYRVHVFNDVVIDYVQKRRRHGDNLNNFIRNHSHGWIFCREGFERQEEIERQALLALKALHLDFGAVDIIQEALTGLVYVLEVNTAPGLQGTTLQLYATAFKSYMRGEYALS